MHFIGKVLEIKDSSVILPVSKNDDIFCNPILWIAKNVIVFAYRQD